MRIPTCFLVGRERPADRETSLDKETSKAQ